MKINLLIVLVSISLLACGGRSNDESTAQYAMDSVSMPASEEYRASGTSTVSDGYDQAPLDQAKMEKEMSEVSTSQESKKQLSFKPIHESMADTIYLRNVRLSKKFIKTAELRFKVKKVEETTHKIESIALKLGGYVHESNIKSNYVSGRNIELSADSMLNVFEYYVDNHLVIRVPCIYFDSVMNEIAKLHIYLDYRNVKTEDVSTTFLRNKWKAEKKAEYEKRIQKASDQGNRRLDDIVEAERVASEMADVAIDRKIENYQLQDRIDFSTITIDLYQSNSVHQEKTKNTRLHSYQPNFWQRAWEAIQTGWDVILNVLIGLIYIWPLYLLAALVYFGIVYVRKRFTRKE